MSCREHGNFKWYACGPTVYDDAHLGHARVYVTFDIIRRILSSIGGVRIDYALGLTDVDDKILKRAAEKGTSPRDLARKYETRFFEDMATMNVLPPTRLLRVTEHIEEQHKMIQQLIRVNAAYATEGGNVFFSLKSSGDRYGQLDPSRSLSNTDSAMPEADPEATKSLGKRDARDFALWKRSSHSDPVSGQWDSPWGTGRPGWHIECSAMAMAALGPHLDLHTGGIDLRFPHHTNELATAEAKLGLQNLSIDSERNNRWCHTWLHCGHLQLQGRKMSKSVKNFITIREFLESGGTADAFRTFCLLHKYSSPIEYAEDRLSDAKSYLARARSFLRRDKFSQSLGQSAAKILAYNTEMSMHPNCPYASSLASATRIAEDGIEQALVDDFDTPRAMSKISQLITEGNASLSNTGEPRSGAAALAYHEASNLVAQTLKEFGIARDVFDPPETETADANNADRHAMADLLVSFRGQVRDAARRKDIGAIFELCDRVRDEAKLTFGIRISDKKDGSSWSRA